jgi:putative DNA primase/helicase
MIPPSIHPNGSHLRFIDINQEATDVEYADLLKSVSFLAACSEITQLWASGRRHELALSFSGLCLKQNVEPQLLINIVQRICQITGDRDQQDQKH